METVATWFSLLRQGPRHAATEGVVKGSVLARDL